MTINVEEVFEAHLLTPAELAEFVKIVRGANKWSQATLAEVAGLTERTIQRVESGEPSSLDTRRALARAFGYDDLDVFDKPWPVPNPKKLKAYAEELERSTVVVPIVRIRDARMIRTMVEGTESCSAHEIGDVTPEARRAFASIVDYLRDYGDAADLYSMAERLTVDQDLDALLKEVAGAAAAVGAGVRRSRVRFKSDAPGCKPMDWTNVSIVLAPSDALPPSIRLAKAFKLA